MSIHNVEASRVTGRLGLAWANVLELMREGRISEPYGTPFDVAAQLASFSLRRYRAAHDPHRPPTIGPILLVPPLMVTAEVYDISRDTSAVRALLAADADVWVIDFGAPEQAPGGMTRTLDDHVRAISRALDHVHAATGRRVHLAGYSQGGMFCYQAAAWRKGAGLASVIAFGSPVDWHRALPRVAPAIADKLLGGLRTVLDAPLARITRVPGAVAAAGFKLVSAKKEVGQLVEFIGNLHDRDALARREARRLFLGGDGFISWPGPAMRAFIDELVVANRLTAGGLVLDGEVVSLANLACPILYFVGEHDEIARAPAVRAIVDAVPAHAQVYEGAVPTGHFGLVVGRIAQAQTWPQVAAWLGWVGSDAPPPPPLRRVTRGVGDRAAATVADAGANADAEAAHAPTANTTPSWRDVLAQTADALAGKAADAGASLGRHLENARWQVPRLSALATLRDDTAISIGRALAEQAHALGAQTLFLWSGRAVSYAQANARVDDVAAALAAHGIAPGDAVAVWMNSRPSLLIAVVALNRLGAVAVVVPPQLSAMAAFDAASLTHTELALVDPEHAAAAAQVFATVIDIKALAAAPGGPPAPNPGLARDLALILVRKTDDGGLRTSHITNRRWAFSALGAAAACVLTGRDTVYCCLPLHHPSGLLVAASSALVGGARLALAPKYEPAQLLRDARAYGVTVVFYAGDVCRLLVEAPASDQEVGLPIRLFAGSGLSAHDWRQMKARFRAGIVEFYGASEASVVLVNASGEKIGSVGRPLPGSAQVAIAGFDLQRGEVRRGPDGHVMALSAGEPGLLIAKLEGDWHRLAARAPHAILTDVFAFGDRWYATRELATMDADGDVFLVGRVDRATTPMTAPAAPQPSNDAA